MFCCPLQVYASDDLSGWDTWTVGERVKYYGYQLGDIIATSVSAYFQRDATLIIDDIMRTEYDDDLTKTLSYDEWIADRLGVVQDETTKEYKLTIDDELSDAIYRACQKYITEETGWTTLYSYGLRNCYDWFGSQASYEKVKEVIENKGTNQIAVFNKIYDYKQGGYFFSVEVADYDGLVMYDGKLTSWGNYSVYSEHNWTGLDYGFKSSNGYETENGKLYAVKDADGSDYMTGWSALITPMHNTTFKATPTYNHLVDWGVGSPWLVDFEPKAYRVYKSLDDYKAYSVGTRPYFVTSGFTNYDMSQDNSTTINHNGLTYDDIVGALPTDGSGNGLSEDQLRELIDALLEASKNNGNSDDDDERPWWDVWGITELFDGLDSVFGVIIGIVGKLLSYIGQALELFTGTIDKIINIIPQNVTALMTGLFPFLPEEWTVVIELSLVLGVVAVIVGIFKK